MHMLLTVLAGMLLLSVFLLFGHLWGATGSAVALGAKVFIPAWLAVALAHMWVGVNLSGYTVRQELPILGVVFLVPAVAAGLSVWYFSKP
ncbi:MAG: hypothetical protein IPH30_16860 [Betaproteobacteria bacterium]|nr:hypothetical protein [Betaproteobacteria bacterium]